MHTNSYISFIQKFTNVTRVLAGTEEVVLEAMAPPITSACVRKHTRGQNVK